MINFISFFDYTENDFFRPKEKEDDDDDKQILALEMDTKAMPAGPFSLCNLYKNKREANN